MIKESQFREVVEANKDRIYRICCCYIRDEMERNDVYQEVLIHIWEGLDRFEEKSWMSTWVYRIAVNTCLGHVRTQTRRRKVFDERSGIDEETLADDTSAEATEEADWEINLLYDSINQLLPLEKTLVSLYLEDLSTAEMSDIVGISEANVRVKLHRIKKKLKEMAGGNEHGS
jgi:RNA polymerase sigma factor (sigma-70 family)